MTSVLQSPATVAQAIALWRSGRHQEAERLCELLVKGPAGADALGLLAEIYGATGRASEELSSLRRLTELKPQDAAVWRRRGNAELARGESTSAVSSYQRALEIEPDNVRGHNNLGQALMRLSRYPEAAASFRRATELSPGYALAHNNLGNALFQQAQVDAALERYRLALVLDPKLTEAHHNCGNVLLRLDRPLEALECYHRALELKPASVDVLRGRGDALSRMKRFEEALTSYQAALQLDPDNARLLTSASDVLTELQRPMEALGYRERALREEPQSADAQNSRAAALNGLGRFSEALACCERALALRPDFPEAWANRAIALRKTHCYEEARAACERALELRPDFLTPLCTLTEVLDVMGLQQDARDCLRRILELDPNLADARIMSVMSCIPSVAADVEEVAASRVVFAERFAEFEAWVYSHPEVEEAGMVGSSTPFHLAYQHHSNRDLLSRYGRLCSDLMARWQRRQTWTTRQIADRASDKLRVGVVSAHIRDHSVYRALVKGWIEQLDRARFEMGVLHLGFDQDSETAHAKASADFFIEGPRTLSQWIETIQSLGLDVLIYPEIGMNATTVQLASLRLAPHQLASWGHPETTGLPTIDYYLSARDFEPPEAQDYYSERLVPLPNLGCYYEPYGLTPVMPDLGRLGIGAGHPVFVSAGMPFKYAPQHDHLFAEIAQRVGRCQFVLFDVAVPRLAERLHERLFAAFRSRGLDPAEFLVFVPWLPLSEFFGLMQCADVLLDTVGFSGFNTIMQAVECGLPIVAFQGRFMRGRLGSGVVQAAGLPDLIARTEGEYVDLAIRVATDTAFRGEVRQRLASGRERLFRDRTAIDGLAEFLYSLPQLSRNLNRPPAS